MRGGRQAFISAIEVWRPDGDLLQRDSGAYGRLAEFERASVELTLRKGQGLPGAVWSTMRPEVWHELGPRFVRAEPAQTAGIGAAVALPLFHGSQLVAVVAFFCGAAPAGEGCIEVWEPSEDGVLEHADGYYGRLTQFEKVSRESTFLPGIGLPGMVWMRGAPHVIDDLGNSSSFLRAQAARESGVESGLGIPLYCGGVIAQVVLFLSAASTPLARAFEVWVPHAQEQLAREQAFYAPELASFGAARSALRFSRGQGLPGRAWASGLPFTASTATGSYQLEPAHEAGLELALALPIDDGERVCAVVMMFV